MLKHGSGHEPGQQPSSGLAHPLLKLTHLGINWEEKRSASKHDVAVTWSRQPDSQEQGWGSSRPRFAQHHSSLGTNYNARNTTPWSRSGESYSERVLGVKDAQNPAHISLFLLLASARCPGHPESWGISTGGISGSSMECKGLSNVSKHLLQLEASPSSSHLHYCKIQHEPQLRNSFNS